MNLETILENHKSRPRQKQCKHCRVRYEYQGATDGFCSEKCRKDLEKQKENKRKEREKERKAKKKETKRNSVSHMKEKLHVIWSKIVRAKAGYKCEYCGRGIGDVQLHAHHIYTRVRNSTRFDIDNGICLCASHHTMSEEFSAHKTGIEFAEWIKEYKGEEFIEELRQKSMEILHITPESLKNEEERLSGILSSYLTE